MLKLQHQVQVQQCHNVLTTTTTTWHNPNVSSSTAPTTIAQWQWMSWSLTEGLKDGLKTQKCLEPPRYVYIYIYSNNAYLLYTTCTDGNDEDKWPHLHHIPMPSRWIGLETHCDLSPQFSFLLLPITQMTNEEQGSRHQHVLSLVCF